MLNPEEFQNKIYPMYQEWVKSQEDQTDAYEYEASLVRFIQEMGQEILLASSESGSSQGRKKKSKRASGMSN